MTMIDGPRPRWLAALLFALLALFAAVLVGKPQQVASAAAAPVRLKEAYARLPLSFEPNRGQAAAGVDFVSRGNGYSLFLAGGEAVLALRQGGKQHRRTVALAGPAPAVPA